MEVCFFAISEELMCLILYYSEQIHHDEATEL